jgi:hypothetical protein
LPGIFLEGLRKEARNLRQDVPAETESDHLPNASLERYRYINLLRVNNYYNYYEL